VKRIVLVAGLLILAACASYRVKEQRTTQGPLAEDLWMTNVILANGREPNFDERRYWNNQIEYRISQYLHQHPEAANSLDVTTFRFVRQVSVAGPHIGVARSESSPPFPWPEYRIPLISAIPIADCAVAIEAFWV